MAEAQTGPQVKQVGSVFVVMDGGKIKQVLNAGDTDLKPMTEAQTDKLAAYDDAEASLNDLETKLSGTTTGPILGWLRSKNPYEKKAKEINNIIIGMVPGLARCVFREVGVLTDTDFVRYTQLLPNMKSPEGIRQMLIDDLKAKLQRGRNISIMAIAKSGRDVSGWMQGAQSPTAAPTVKRRWNTATRKWVE